MYNFYIEYVARNLLIEYREFEMLFYCQSCCLIYHTVEKPSLKIDARRTLWLSDHIKRFISQYFIEDAVKS